MSATPRAKGLIRGGAPQRACGLILPGCCRQRTCLLVTSKAVAAAAVVAAAAAAAAGLLVEGRS